MPDIIPIIRPRFFSPHSLATKISKDLQKAANLALCLQSLYNAAL